MFVQGVWSGDAEKEHRCGCRGLPCHTHHRVQSSLLLVCSSHQRNAGHGNKHSTHTRGRALPSSHQPLHGSSHHSSVEFLTLISQKLLVDFFSQEFQLQIKPGLWCHPWCETFFFLKCRILVSRLEITSHPRDLIFFFLFSGGKQSLHPQCVLYCLYLNTPFFVWTLSLIKECEAVSSKCPVP